MATLDPEFFLLPVKQMSTDPNAIQSAYVTPVPEGGRESFEVHDWNRVKSSDGEHGWIASRILIRLGTHVESNDLGKTFAAETGFLIEFDPDTVRAPDAAFVSHERLESAPPSSTYLKIAPDLVVEVVSPNDTSSEVEAKAEQWLDAGSRIILVADPKNQTLRANRNKAQIEVLHQGEEFSSGDVCGFWKISVNEVFDIQD